MLDKKDLKILQQLDLDARKPISEIARNIKLSKEVTNYRLKKLEKGIIEHYYSIIDSSRLGYMNFRLLITFERTTPEIEKQFIEFTKSLDAVSWVAILAGRYDVVVTFMVKSVPELHSAVQTIYEKFVNYIKERNLSVVSSIYNFEHKFLYNSSQSKAIVTGNQGIITIDKIDETILDCISMNVRIPLLEISKKCNLTPNAVKARLKSLKKKGVLLGYNLKLNYPSLGYTNRKTCLNFYNYSSKELSKLMTYLKKEKNVIYITKSVGLCDLEFETLFSSHKDYSKFMDRLRTEFKDFIREHFTLITAEEPVACYF
ncbi:AsnC family transcriptional regulator [Candidatus Woesearchaeota archaeon]|nr:AsnC family transcriptional regulator [Candidatus Woesearchaeota archaeon]MBW3022231.1 AsnC family transcriptional regulator [Candidatus Woesearchaeota archaeon]